MTIASKKRPGVAAIANRPLWQKVFLWNTIFVFLPFCFLLCLSPKLEHPVRALQCTAADHITSRGGMHTWTHMSLWGIDAGTHAAAGASASALRTNPAVCAYAHDVSAWTWRPRAVPAASVPAAAAAT